MNMRNCEEFIPSSIEEWIEIHGEPNYIDSESTASSFALVTSVGNANYCGASNSFGVRPVFLLS